MNTTEKFDLYDAAERQKAKYARAEKIRKIKNIIKIVIIGLIVAYLLGSCIKDSIETKERNKLRNFATDKVDETSNNVYAHIVSVDPKYTLTKRTVGKNGNEIFNTEDFPDIICECKTVEGKTIWAVIPYRFYPKIDIINRYFPGTGFEPYVYGETTPAKMHGSAEPAYKIADELDDKIGDVLVFDVNSIEDKQ